MHCFHYLIPLAKEGNYSIVANVESMDYDPLVVKLNKDISAIEEAMGAALQQHKFQYIFEGQHGSESGVSLHVPFPPFESSQADDGPCCLSPLLSHQVWVT